MNVGPASAVWSVRGGVDLVTQRDARAPDSKSSGAREERTSGARAAGSGDGMDARLMLQLLKGGRVSSVADVRLRASVREAAKASAGQADTIGRASARDGTAALRDPLRDLLHTGLFDEAMQTMLAEVFTQFKAEADEADEAETALDSEEVVDAQQLYEEMKETFEKFHASLKRIFRLVDGPEAEAPWPEGETEGGGASSELTTAAEARADSAAERASAVQEELVERIAAAYQETLDAAPSATEAEDFGESKKGEDGAYTRLAAAYEARYDAPSGDEHASFSTEG